MSSGRKNPLGKKKNFHGRTPAEGLTTGQIARGLGVAPRTVAKWCDTGHLRCHRLPRVTAESRTDGDRRIAIDNLLQFLGPGDLANRARERWLDGPRILLVDVEEHIVNPLRGLAPDFLYLCVDNLFDAGVKSRTPNLAGAILDSRMGRTEALTVGKGLRVAHPDMVILGIIGEDEPDEIDWSLAGFTSLKRRPVSAEELARALLGVR